MVSSGMTQVYWTNAKGEPRRHSLYRCSLSYVRAWFQTSIIESGGMGSILLRVENHL